MKKLFLLSVILVCIVFLTGCLKRDEMEDIEVITTIYPIEYVTNRLYGNSSTISSIYPKDVDYTTYKMTNKQIKDFSDKGLFIYNGLDTEREYATKFLNQNKNLRIIDASFGISYTDDPKEVWLNPSNLLMMAQNIRNSLQNYITNPYMIEEIDESYSSLKVDITQIDTELTKVASSADNKKIIVADETFNFLSKYGFEVVNLTENGNVIDKNYKTAVSLLENNSNSYIFVMDNSANVNSTVKGLKDKYNCELLVLKTLSTISDEDIANSFDYLSIMYDNVDQIKKEVY